MKVALITEGTYPHQPGGVSVWCDQLIRGLPGHDFVVVPLVATGAEPLRWPLPANVRALAPIPLWGRPPPAPRRARPGGPRGRALAGDLISLLASPPGEDLHDFGCLLRELTCYAQRASLPSLLGGQDAVRALAAAWQRRWPLAGRGTTQGPPPGPAAGGPAPPGTAPATAAAVPVLHDAVVAMQLVEHALRPLSHAAVQADVVHTVANGIGALPALAAKWQHGTPVILTEHGLYLREQYLWHRSQYRWPVKELFLGFLRRLCALGYAGADMITPGNAYNQRWERKLGAEPARIRTIYNGVDPAAFPALDGEPDAPVLAWAGRVDPVKDLETLLRAFALVAAEVPGARLRLFGAPPAGREGYLAHCQRLAASLGLAGRATFEGAIPRIHDAYAAGQVVVLSSITEGIPYTLIEAMACGRPCVATEVGGVPEALGSTGLLVPPRNPAALAAACRRLLADAALRHRLGRAARQRALTMFTADRAIRAFCGLYQDFGARPGQAAAAPAAIAGAAAGVRAVREGHTPRMTAAGRAGAGDAVAGTAVAGTAVAGTAVAGTAVAGTAVAEAQT
jgi:glycosyltransferase involved in cell wall biosynthesis